MLHLLFVCVCVCYAFCVIWCLRVDRCFAQALVRSSRDCSKTVYRVFLLYLLFAVFPVVLYSLVCMCLVCLLILHDCSKTNPCPWGVSRARVLAFSSALFAEVLRRLSLSPVKLPASTAEICSDDELRRFMEMFVRTLRGYSSKGGAVGGGCSGWG